MESRNHDKEQNRDEEEDRDEEEGRDEENRDEEESRDDFKEALEAGDEQYVMYEEELQAQSDPMFQIVSIKEAREKGFMPIAFIPG